MKINIELDEHDVDEALDILRQIQELQDTIDEMRLIIADFRDLLDEQKEMPWSYSAVS